MKNLKTLYPLAAGMAAILLLTVSGGCSQATDPDPGPTGTQTTIQFVNSGLFPVSVYSVPDRQAQSKIADIEPNGSSNVITWTPSPAGYSFYLSFILYIDDLQIPFVPAGDRGVTIARIDAGKTTSINIPTIETIYTDKNVFITSDVYLSIKNNGGSALRLQKGNMVIERYDFPATDLVNTNETALYKLEAGPASAYSLLVNATNHTLPLTDFEAGHLYTMVYHGTSLSSDNDKPMTIENASSGGGMGGLPVPSGLQAVKVSSGVQLSWNPVAGAAYYEVYRGASAPGVYSSISANTITAASYTDTNPNSAGINYYKVRAYSGDYSKSSNYSASISVVDAGLYDGAIDAAHKIGNQNLAEALAYISGNATHGKKYFIVLGADEVVTAKNLSYSMKTVSITLTGLGNRTVRLSGNGSMFAIWEGVALVLDSGITLKGHSGNTSSLVYVGQNGTFTMEGGEISGNTIASYSGGGVVVAAGGTFTMEGGEISGNTASFGGGGGVAVSGTFTMEGGEISGNAASSSVYSGGGVYVAGGTFTMEGGEISGNTASSSVYSGGGVYVAGGTFTMEGGEISGNTASFSSSNDSSYSGGGVYIAGGTFTMESGEISGNTASSSSSSHSAYSGGGVYIAGGTFTMKGGEISGNIASSTSASYSAYSGGGVAVGGTFTMEGGEISGNTASSSTSSSSAYSGGGVYDYSNAFTKTGGIIYGSNASEPLKNTAAGNNCGYAVFVRASSQIRDTTAGESVNLNSGVAGSAGGWE